VTRPLFFLILALSGCPCRGAVFLIGLDGATWDVADPLIRQGRMPNLRKCLAHGARAVLRSSDWTYSPLIWTSIATGKKVAKHGIRDFYVGQRRYTSSDRRCAALWNMLTRQGRTVCSVGYMMTWPVERVAGVMVSDQYFSRLISDQLVYPPDLSLSTPRHKQGRRRALLRLARRLTPFVADPGWEKLPKDSPAYLENLIFWHRLSYALKHDEGFTDIAEELLAKRAYDLFLIHLWGIDLVSHGFWKYQAGARAAPKHPFSRIVPRYYAYIDSLLGRLLRFVGPQDTVIIVSDHGMRARSAADGAAQPYLSGAHHPDGVFAAAGPQVAVVRRQGRVGECDIAPTVLRLLGLPAARDMDGRVLSDILRPGLAAVDDIATYEEPGRPSGSDAAPGTPLSPDELELLKASGYIR